MTAQKCGARKYRKIGSIPWVDVAKKVILAMAKFCLMPKR